MIKRNILSTLILKSLTLIAIGQNNFEFRGGIGITPVQIIHEAGEPNRVGLYMDLGFYYTINRFSIGLRSGIYYYNDIFVEGNYSVERNPDVANVLRYLDPFFQETTTSNNLSTGLIVQYGLPITNKLRIGCGGGVNWLFGSFTRTTLIAPGNLEPTKVFYSKKGTNFLNANINIFMDYKIKNDIRVGIQGTAETRLSLNIFLATSI